MTEFKKIKPRYDRKTAFDGIWVYPVDEVDNEYGGFRVGLYSPAFPRVAISKEKLERLGNAAAKMKRGEDAKEAADRRVYQHIVESCVLDWDMTDAKGKPVPFSVDAAVDYFMVNELDEVTGERLYVHDFVFNAIMKIAQDVTQFQSDEQNEAGDALGNSSPVSTSK